MQASHPVAIARSKTDGTSTEDGSGRRAAMRRLHDGKNRRPPATFVETGREFHIFVIGKEALIENALAQRRTPVEGRGGRNSPRFGQQRADGDPVTDLPKGAI